mmetsp:Transcript_13378/g.33604  ORF Transcript_13378/g.33604 Transcript_13378/m.33604 type:complete len:207 (+) Transcript_13378:1380-2000(+)
MQFLRVRVCACVRVCCGHCSSLSLCAILPDLRLFEQFEHPVLVVNARVGGYSLGFLEHTPQPRSWLHTGLAREPGAANNPPSLHLAPDGRSEAPPQLGVPVKEGRSSRGGGEGARVAAKAEVHDLVGTVRVEPDDVQDVDGARRLHVPELCHHQSSSPLLLGHPEVVAQALVRLQGGSRRQQGRNARARHPRSEIPPFCSTLRHSG